MIGKLTGIICSLSEDSLIIDVNGVGYLTFISSSLKQKLALGEKVSLFIETYVREDSITLFAFITESDKQVFNLLKTVQGVGPKLALAIMSLEASVILNAIIIQDTKKLQNVSGVGAKVASRITSELKDKVNKLFSGEHLTSLNSRDANNSLLTSTNNAIEALQSLGYSYKEAERAVKYVISNNSDGDMKNNTEELVKQSLSYFLKNSKPN